MVRAGQLTDGRFGSKADVRTAIGHVRFTPNNEGVVRWRLPTHC
jgi:hypothetical protein